MEFAFVFHTNYHKYITMTKTVTISEQEAEAESEVEIKKEPVEDSESMNDEDDDEEDDEEDEMDFEPQMDFGQLLSNFFVTENGVNVADALMELKDSVDIHNKLLHKFIKLKFGK